MTALIRVNNAHCAIFTHAPLLVPNWEMQVIPKVKKNCNLTLSLLRMINIKPLQPHPAEILHCTQCEELGFLAYLDERLSYHQFSLQRVRENLLFGEIRHCAEFPATSDHSWMPRSIKGYVNITKECFSTFKIPKVVGYSADSAMAPNNQYVTYQLTLFSRHISLMLQCHIIARYCMLVSRISPAASHRTGHRQTAPAEGISCLAVQLVQATPVIRFSSTNWHMCCTPLPGVPRCSTRSSSQTTLAQNNIRPWGESEGEKLGGGGGGGRGKRRGSSSLSMKEPDTQVRSELVFIPAQSGVIGKKLNLSTEWLNWHFSCCEVSLLCESVVRVYSNNRNFFARYIGCLLYRWCWPAGHKCLKIFIRRSRARRKRGFQTKLVIIWERSISPVNVIRNNNHISNRC